MYDKIVRPTPEVDKVTHELTSFLAQFTDEEISTGAIARGGSVVEDSENPSWRESKLGRGGIEPPLRSLPHINSLEPNSARHPSTRWQHSCQNPRSAVPNEKLN